MKLKTKIGKSVLFLVLLLITIAGASALTPPDGGVSYYNFSSTTDLWGSNDATNNGATSVTDYPVYNMSGDSSPNSFSFDGVDDRLSFSYKEIQANEEYSFTGWFKTSDSGGSIIGNYEEVGQTYAIVQLVSGKLRYITEGTTSTTSQSIETTNAYNDNIWHYYAVISDGIKQYIYIDGKLEVSATITESGRLTSIDNWRIGNQYVQSSSTEEYYLNGQIDEVKIYNRSLNETEISNLYNYGSIEDPFENFSITAINIYNESPVFNFSVEIDGYDNYTTENGSVTTDLLINESQSYNITFFNSTYANRTYSDYVISTDLEGVLFYNDTESPQRNATFPDIETFNNNSVTVSLNCTDDLAPNITYQLAFNDVYYYNGTYANATLLQKKVNMTEGVNSLYTSCDDFVTEANESTDVKTFYEANIALIDEETGNAVDLNQLDTARIYNDRNATIYDFKSENTTTVNYTSTIEGNIRIVLGDYSIYGIGDNLEIARWINTALVPEDDVKVCANERTVTHYEQLPYSTIEKPVLIKSMFADCYVSADYTRFAYQDALTLRSYTINSLYYLYTLDSGSTEYLASLDGGISTSVNIDNLEFNKEGYSIQPYEDSLAVSKTDDTELTIYYRNIYDDLKSSELTISNSKTGEIYFSVTELSNPENFTVTWDYSSFADEINESTLFKASIRKTDSDGEESSVIKYFNASGKVGLIHPLMAALVGALLAFFGMSTVLSKDTFGWFGAMMSLAGVVVCSFGLTEWYVYYVMFINIIILVYVSIIAIYKNYSEIG